VLRGPAEPDLASSTPHRHPAVLRGPAEPDLASSTPHRHPAVLRGPAEPDLASSAPREHSPDHGARRVELDELFARADVVSLHCPLTAETRHLVDARRLALLRPTAIIINTARGACIDDGALADALTAGRLFAAGLDVFSDEPAIDRRLLAAPRVVLAPHLGSATTETRMQMAQLCADGVAAVLAGRRPANLVNGEVWDRRREPARGPA
jgi:phosphoglycerate dehydrogenase-like enzyme